MTIRKLSVAALVAMVLITGIWYAVVYRGQASHLKTLDAQESTAEQNLSALQVQYASLLQEKKELKPEEKLLSVLQTAVPPGPSLDQLVDVIREAVQQAGVKLTSASTPVPSQWAPGSSSSATSASTGVIPLSFSITVQGSNSQVLHLVSALDAQKRLLTVGSFTLGSVASGGPQVQATTLSVNAYYGNRAAQVPTYPGVVKPAA